MIRKVVIAGLVLLLVLVGGAFFWARSVFGRDTVRTALARQLSDAIGQPVGIGTISASIYPRVTVQLGAVTIGEPARIRAESLDIGTDFRALLSRRIEHGTMRLDKARIELPLPALTIGRETEPSSQDGRAAVDIVSIDEIVLDDVEIVSGGRTLTGGVELVPEGDGLIVRRLTLAAEDTTLDATGRFTNLTGPVGEVDIKAGALNLDRLLAFAADFSSGAGLGSAAAPPGEASPAPAVPMNVVLSLESPRASIGALAVEALTGRARLTDRGVALEPLAFGLFGGRYEGGLTVGFDAGAPSFRWNAKLSGIDVAAATDFAGRPNTMTGRLAGRIDVTGRGADAGSALASARGTARLDVTDGIIRNLGLVRTVVIATSMRADAQQQPSGSSDEPFSRLGATLNVAGGSARTSDLTLESDNLRLAAAGTMRLDGSAVDLAGRVQLSDRLSKQAGRDLVRYTQEQGRVTLPATITGPVDNLKVRIDVADVAKRALRNKATEEVDKAIKRGLGDLFKRR